jgi:C-terminal processing protease CtpA/Prc
VPNIDKAATAKRITIEKRIGRLAVTGSVDGFGFVAFSSLQGSEAELAELDRALEAMTARPGIIFDLRQNIGGQETQAQRIVSWVTDETRVYGLVDYRAGKGFAAPIARRIGTRSGASYRKPVAVLVGPVCLSSCEGMALMLAALPHATLVGEPTGGASANPQPVELPNGVSVVYSRWRSTTPEGGAIEGKGIPPDVVVTHAAGGDPVLEAAVGILKKKSK